MAALSSAGSGSARCRSPSAASPDVQNRDLAAARPNNGPTVPQGAGNRSLGMGTWFKVPQAAEYAGVSRETIYTACARAKLRHVRIGGRRAIRLKSEWVNDWLERYARGAVRQTGGLRAA